MRAGKFKKASNMNYCLSFSLRVEDELLRLIKDKAENKGKPAEGISVEEKEQLYQKALQNILAKDEGKTMAEGNVRMGDLILFIDCDTRVVSWILSLSRIVLLTRFKPEDCLSLGEMEMEESPQVAIIQHASGVMQVIHSVFENASEFFALAIFSFTNSASHLFHKSRLSPNQILRWKRGLRTLRWSQRIPAMEGDTKCVIHRRRGRKVLVRIPCFRRF